MMSQKRSPALMRETLKAFIAEIRDEIRDQKPVAAPRNKEPEPS
jgi:chemotaxis protein MotA